jgi:hypothetical protein
MESQFKAWRKQRAERENIPALHVCNNMVADAILSSMPQTKEALLAIEGVNAHFVSRYANGPNGMLALLCGKKPTTGTPTVDGLFNGESYGAVHPINVSLRQIWVLAGSTRRMLAWLTFQKKTHRTSCRH